MNEDHYKLPFLVTIYRGKNGSPNYDIKRAISSYEKVKDIRSRIIEKALDIESSLTLTIITFILGEKKYRELRLLRSLVFDAEFCNFMQKRKMLSRIFNICGERIQCFTVEEGKQLRRNLNRLILERDKFAHGQILIDTFEYKPFIVYYRNGEQRDEIFDNLRDVFLKQCREVESSLAKLRDYFKANKIEL